jgi:hypothetical protein
MSGLIVMHLQEVVRGVRDGLMDLRAVNAGLYMHACIGVMRARDFEPFTQSEMPKVN